MNLKNVWLFFLMFPVLVVPQNLSLRSNHPVYDFLNILRVKNILPNYEDVVLPLTRGEIFYQLQNANDSVASLSEIDKRKLNYFLRYFPSRRASANSFFCNDSSSLTKHFFSSEENYAYLYQDSLLSFSIAPIVTTKNIYLKDLNDKGRSAFLFTFGGAFSLEYNDWFAAYLEAWNGILTGEKNAAITDQRVKQSFTFYHTGIHYFDQTSGYVILKKDIFKLQIGRERILWGVDRFDQSILNESPQMFDFVKFDISYKQFSYKFLHGWLVQPTSTAFVDSLQYDVKSRNPKYIVTSRLGYQPFHNLSLGIGQTIIYANSPLELAYLNPFLLWESAQRSLNDLDNSFLHFDSRYRPCRGLEINGTLTLDDLNFEFLKKGKWNSAGNRIAWQMGFTSTAPLVFDRLTLYGDYVQIRPYTYSHPNGGEELTYTNNGFPLGLDLQPNSAMTSIKVVYDFNEKLSSSFLFRYTMHGDNIFDSNGKLLKNVGGSIFLSTRYFDSPVAIFLDGEKVTTNFYQLNLRYFLSYNLNVSFQGQYIRYAKLKNLEERFLSSLQINYNIY